LASSSLEGLSRVGRVEEVILSNGGRGVPIGTVSIIENQTGYGEGFTKRTGGIGGSLLTGVTAGRDRSATLTGSP
jgi:hypothetical protein